MKIAYVLYSGAIISGDSNGIKSQAKSWGKALTDKGHKVVELNVWGNYNWKEFDIIHIFGTGLWLYAFVKGLQLKNKNIVVSPIIDSIQSKFYYRLSTFIGFEKLRLWSPTYTLKKTLPLLKGVFVRSDYESEFFSKSMRLSNNYIFKVPLSFSSKSNTVIDKKEKFCLHISSVYQDRKNVVRLIKAAKKYKFNLVLAGSKGTEEQFKKIKYEIGESKYIKVIGFISQNEMVNLYQRAKVFALPSISEGVGIVALDAALYGCEIVITNIGGPKEYYNRMAKIVNPYSVDEIGKAVVELLNKKGFQPQLQEYIQLNYSEKKIISDLENAYVKICEND